MEATLSIVLPVFGLMLAGYGLGRTPLISEDGARGITNFVLYAAIPALLFRTMSRLDDLPDADLTIYAAYYLPAFLVMATGVLIGLKVYRLSLQQSALMGMGGSFSNTVLLGLAIVYFTFGEKGLLPMTLIVAIHPIIFIAIPTVLIEIDRGRAQGDGDSGSGDGRVQTAWRIFRTTLWSLLRNPPVVGMAAGALYGLTGWGFHPIVGRFLELLSNAAAPAALFALGASLVGFRIAGALAHTLTMTAFKLMVMPAAVFVSCHYVFGMDPLWVAVATINAGMPAGVNVFMLASLYNTYVQRAAAAVLLTTLLSMVTVAVIISQFIDLAK